MQFAYGYGGAASPLVQEHLTASPYRRRRAVLLSHYLAPSPAYLGRLGPARLRPRRASSDGLDPIALQLAQRGASDTPAILRVAPIEREFHWAR